MSEPKTKSSIISVIVLVIIIGVVGVLLLNRQLIIDQVKAAQYQPTQAAKQLRSDLSLTALGEQYYDASQTKIEPKDQFNQDCVQQKETNNPILGCYTSQLIFIYDVTNKQLNGIKKTTAAHELLHAAYTRMGDSERTEVDKEVKATYARVKTPDLEKRMQYYQKSEPGQELNELHSILGTEFGDVGSKLEAHYAMYFKSRAKIVAYYEQYSGVFSSVQNQLKGLQSEINSDTASINQRINSYNSAVAQLNKDTDSFNQRSQNGGFATQAEFDSERSALEARRSQLDSEKTDIKSTIDAVEQVRTSYNQLVVQYNELNRSINSSLSPVPTF